MRFVCNISNSPKPNLIVSKKLGSIGLNDVSLVFCPEKNRCCLYLNNELSSVPATYCESMSASLVITKLCIFSFEPFLPSRHGETAYALEENISLMSNPLL